MIIVENVTKSYRRGHFALQNLSFEIVPHSFTAILGASGSGKTTLLRCLLQLTQPDTGKIWFQGRNLTHCSALELRQARTQIAMVAQQFNLVRRRTALENCLGGCLPDLPLWRCLTSQFPANLLREGLAALERVQLLEVAFQRADCLSGGQQQRVAIARALTQKARLILADEPVASLDPETAHVVLRLLRSLCEKEGITIICNLHQVELATQYSDRILGIQAGKLVLDVPTHQFSDSDSDVIYKTRSVA
ncbi:phosphonate ABC transporter ATP-binding protein [Gloeocapsopsis dulcis]|uniref:Phosphonate ABC transporter ATP-binding protein n=1 Tax=Gloeocapsopsis dulcis AAB1 = 1H9 TaxID=1433147 RepID=A0A6N8FSF2_9CHRO|nr:phosphonate ABC transporter ATP-binding protein [Gloeocapsopsis dulcis]MUL36060.1 phosphonate ABC transporter ATP-binding protein [Gloeocapsopsis dulcis AAB1 = 1H9]WNN91471.1 phosphonate ABC transporter ATP-binding protein [Gloeocapsopsis dulcis]